MRKSVRKIVLLLLCLLLLTGCEKKGATALTNTSFESETGSTVTGWSLECYDSTLQSAAAVTAASDAPDGQNVAVLQSTSENDIRLVQNIYVKKGHSYRLTALVRTVNVTGENEGGACLSVMDTFLHSDYVSGTSDWTTLTLTIKATKSETLGLALRLGFFGATQTGTAYFDKVEWIDVTSAGIDGEDVTHIDEQPAATEEKTDSDILTSVLFRGLLYGVLMLVCFVLAKKHFPARSDKLFYILLGAAFVLRAVLAVCYKGFHIDINCFSLWGERMLQTGPFAFYDTEYFCDYPPLYMLVCGGEALAAKIFGVSLSSGFGLLLLKLPAIVCDLLSAVLIYRIAKRHITGSLPAVLGLLYAFLPAAILNSSLWGQVDGILVLLILSALDLLDRDRFGLAAGVWFIALFTKPQTVLFGPVMLLATVREFAVIASEKDVSEKKRRLLWGFGSLFFGILLFVLLSLTMANGQPFTWLYDKYFGTLGSYDYASLNSFGFMALLGGQWAPCENESPFGVSFGTLGTVGIVLVLLYTAFLFTAEMLRTKGKMPASSLWLYAALSVMGVVVFAARSHERYLFPVIALLLVSYIRTKDRRLLPCAFATAVISFLNAAAVLYLYEENGNYMASGDVLLRLGSFAVTALFIAVAVIAFTHAFGKIPVSEEPPEAKKPPQKTVSKAFAKKNAAVERMLLRRSFTLPRVTWKDAVICLLLIAGYGAVALSNLGDTEAVQTEWKSVTGAANTDTVFALDAADYVVADFGEAKHIDRAYYYTGILERDRTFTVSYSADGVNWSSPASQTALIGGLFAWRRVEALTNIENARYVAVSTNEAGLSLMEIGFFENASDETPIAIQSVTSSRTGKGSGECLFDEQSLVPSKPTYMNSMYFDEIYHARTGYETAHGLSIYEISHPPLGKNFIAWSIRSLGMTPFAWRLPGAVAGILMLPVLYFIGLLMFRKRSWATVLPLLMALDGMHFVQSRIATVDSFAILFILLMFLFMYWYQNVSFFNKPLWKTFLPLGLCGISFALGAATKWICLYAGAGLAVIFFITVYRRAKEYAGAKRAVNAAKQEEKAYLQRVIRVFPRYMTATILFCVVFFVLIPAVVYCLSYLPYARAEGETRSLLKVMWDNQQYMYHYHSTLQATHSFSSNWYTWPFMVRPVWMYAGSELLAGERACISSFGNPAVWYVGAVCAVIGIGMFVTRLLQKKSMCLSLDAPVKKSGAFASFFDTGDGDITDRGTVQMELLLFLLLGVAANLLPWVGVDRCLFLYHYFATTPFLMMFTVLVLREYARKKPAAAGRLTIILLAVSSLFFILFKPIWTGTPVSAEYIKTYLKWFDTWYFGV